MSQRVTLLAIVTLLSTSVGCLHHNCGAVYPYDSACYTGNCVDGGCSDGSCTAPTPCGSCGGIGSCTPDCVGAIKTAGKAVAHKIHNSLTCEAGCGGVYWDEWFSDPPDCCDPCDNWGNYHGGTVCGKSGGCDSGCGAGGCGTGGCGKPGCGGGLLQIIGKNWKHLWGYKYHGDCSCGGGHAHGGDCGCGGSHGVAPLPTAPLPGEIYHSTPIPTVAPQPAPTRKPMNGDSSPETEPLPPPAGGNRQAARAYYDRAPQTRSVIR
jgi:hypothetical protein